MWRTGSLWTGIADALAVAVVICPCALTIAQPLAHLRAVGRGAREGLRIADPGQLDALAGVRAAVFDKTGKIGRASCRERVCQYGVDLGGRRTIKNKKTSSRSKCTAVSLRTHKHNAICRQCYSKTQCARLI